MEANARSDVGRPEGHLTRHLPRIVRQVSTLLVACIALALPTAAQSPPAPVAAAAVKTGNAGPTVAFFYGANPPLDELKAFEVVVVEPDHVSDPRPHRRELRDGASELYAYVSFGEVLPSRTWYKQIPPGVLKGENREWGSSVVDHNAPGWREFFVEKVMAPLWERGYRGFFFDTMDSYHLIARTDAARAVQEAAMVETFSALRARFPGLKLFLNRGFEILPQVKDMVSIVGAESLFRGWDQGKRAYREVPAADREWLLGQLNAAKNSHGLAVVAIDYVAPSERTLARETARRIRSLGFVPWVANPELDALGVGSREVMPRRVLVLTDRQDDGGDLHYSGAQRLLGMPLNYLGYSYELIDPRSQALPEGVLAGRYAGIVTWLSPGRGLAEARVAAFLRRHIADGVRVAVFNQFPFALEAKGLRDFGVELIGTAPAGRLAVARRDAMLGFETEVLPRRDLPLLRAGGGGQPLLRLTDVGGNAYDPVALTPWGGYALSPYSWSIHLGMERWVIDPVRFLRAALATPDLPVPDVTTESGRRMLLVHVDGDGWASRAEMAGIAYASEIMEKEVLARYRVPTTVSVIQGETAADGLYSAQAPALEAIARRIFRLPHVEPASHSYSHPFNWAQAEAGAQAPAPAGETYHLKIAGYRFDLRREIAGSIDYIGRSLAPPEKQARVFLWSGNCVPSPAALRTAAAAGLLNMNGGDTTITRSHPTWTRIAPQGIRKEGLYQVFAPNQNENVYTNDWTGPFYGYERVIETFELTETPLRVKPINIYYHTYAASKPASLAALRKVYDWAMKQPTAPVYASEYIRKVQDFESIVVARDLDDGALVVRTGGALRTLRISTEAGLPDLAVSTGVAGVGAGPGGRYLTLAAAQARIVASRAGAVPQPGVAEANGRIDALARAGGNLEFTLTSHVAPTFRLHDAAACGVTINGRPARPAPGTQTYDTDPAGAGRAPHQQVVRVRCVQ